MSDTAVIALIIISITVFVGISVTPRSDPSVSGRRRKIDAVARKTNDPVELDCDAVGRRMTHMFMSCFA
ncbi:MAG: hypothetical protein FWD57_10060 [Polyangiaceae bacterium]|nr:hypothetical protein [Polyangiaceae bacterium]